MFPSNQSHVLGVPKAIINFYELTIYFKHKQFVLELQKNSMQMSSSNLIKAKETISSSPLTV